MKAGSQISLMVVLLFQTHLATAQEPFYHTLTNQDGLPGYNLYEVRQDRDGYIWLASDNGVARFDGGRFEHFTQSDGLTDNDVFMVRPDSKGRIWFLPSNGQPCFWQNGRIHNQANTPFLKKMQAMGWYVAFGEDSKSNLWFATYGNVFVKLDDHNNVSQYDFNVEAEQYVPGQHTISDIKIDKSGDAWLVNSQGVINLSKNPSQVAIPLTFPDGAPQRALYLPDVGVLYAYGDKLCIKTKSDSTMPLKVNIKNGPVSLSQSSNGDIWFSNLYDLYRFKGGNITSENQEVLIRDKPIAGVFIDREQNIWVNTFGEGVWIINQPDILHYKSVFGEGVDPISVFVDHDFRIWIGGDHGRLAWIDNKQMVEVPDVQKMATNGRGRIRSIKSIDNGQFALAFEQKLVFMDKNRIHTRLNLNTRAVLNHRDKYLVGTATSCFVLPKELIPKLNKIQIYSNRDSIGVDTRFMVNYNVLTGHRINDLESDSDGNVWLATSLGLYSWKDGMQKAEPYLHHLSCMQKSVRCVKTLNSEILLVAISGAGLAILKDGRVHLIARSKLLKDLVINRIVPVSEKSFWLCTDNGLFLLTLEEDGKTVTIKPFTTRDGLLSQQVTDIARRGNDWLIISKKGLTVIPSSFLNRKSIKVPSILVASFLINYKPLDTRAEYTENETNVYFSFSCLSFRDFGATEFRYRLSGLDSWKATQQFDQTISNLPQGQYRFEIQARSYSSTWSPSLYFPEFEVLPPVWQRGWFLFLVFLVSSGFTAGVLYLTNRNRLEKLDLDRKLTDANLKALRAQIKPHFIFNALNSVQFYFLGNKKEEGLEFLGRFSMLMRKMLNGSDKQFHSVMDEIGLMGDYLDIEKDRIGRSFQFRIEIDPQIDQEQTLVPTMLLQPLVENALWHGIMHREKEGGEIELEIRLQKDRLLITITDNGVGRKTTGNVRTKEGDSFGVRSIEEKLALLNRRYKSEITIRFEDLTDAQNKPAGTKVILDMPLHFRNV